MKLGIFDKLKTDRSMKKYSLLVAIAAMLLLHGCQKADKLQFSPVGTIDAKKDFVMKDIVPIDDNSFFVLTNDKERPSILDDYSDESVIYTCTVNAGSMSASKTATLDNVLNDLEYVDGELWTCGKAMNLQKSTDKGATWSVVSDFSYWDAYPSEKSTMKKIYAKNSTPFYVIGTDDLMTGNFYYYQDAEYIFHSASKTEFGLNDMVVYNDEAYVAGYGSVMHVTDNGATRNFEDVGGENFTSIAIGGDYLYVSTYSGKIYRSEIGSGEWKKVADEGKKLLYIEANEDGAVIAAGESKTILISVDFGKTWFETSYSAGKEITCLVSIGKDFYIGTEKGAIVKTNKDLMSLNVTE